VCFCAIISVNLNSHMSRRISLTHNPLNNINEHHSLAPSSDSASQSPRNVPSIALDGLPLEGAAVVDLSSERRSRHGTLYESHIQNIELYPIRHGYCMKSMLGEDVSDTINKVSEITISEAVQFCHP
jgi:hypothetical protein